MKYIISYQKPQHHFVDIECQIRAQQAGTLELQLPSWRPGRYEMGNFAKNIQKFTVTDANGQPLSFQKISKDRWQVQVNSPGTVHVYYNYFAYQMDAGGSWLDEQQLYLNFIGCLLYTDAELATPCRIELQLPADYQIACGLEQPEKHVLTAPNYYVLVDSPMIASNRLLHDSYTIEGVEFHIWAMGRPRLDWERLKHDFSRFSAVQIEMMQGFPSRDYHFLFQFLPYKTYHGVEHYNSTIITLGPDYGLMQNELYKSLLGVSSHELFHIWNIIRIRPAEMWPYNFTGENYFTTGFVAEGFTTYYGDVFLARSGVFSLADYLGEINKSLQRHLNNWGRFNHSLTDSSYDLWLDGYNPGIPNRKVSIYIKGSLVALMLDLRIREASDNRHSLDELMRRLMKDWYEQKKGYSYQDIVSLASELAGESMENFFADFVEGRTPLEDELDRLLHRFGLQLRQAGNPSPSQGRFGFRAVQRDGQTVVNEIQPDSVADQYLSRNDELLAVNDMRISNSNLDELLYQQDTIRLSLFRNQRLLHITLEADGRNYYPDTYIVPDPHATEEALHRRKSWLNH